MSWEHIAACIVGLGLAYLWWDAVNQRHVSKRLSNGPSPHTNHTIPPKKALIVAVAIAEEKPAIFHGGCCDCLFRHRNTTHTGLAFCRGCQYFAPNWSEQDRRVSESSLEKI